MKSLSHIGRAFLTAWDTLFLKGELHMSRASTALIDCMTTVVEDRPTHLDVDVTWRNYTDSVELRSSAPLMSGVSMPGHIFDSRTPARSSQSCS